MHIPGRYPGRIPFYIYLLVLSLFTPGCLWALEPEEILLIVNSESRDSLRISRYYVSKRALPEENVVVLKCPVSDSISRRDFEAAIAGPLKRVLMMPGWAVKTRCLLLTMGIPLRIKPDGMTRHEELAFAKTKERIRALKDLMDDPKTDRKRKKKYKKEIRKLERELSVLNHHSETASVDSELTLLKRYGDYSLGWWIPNPLYFPSRASGKRLIRPSEVLMVSRLDAPDLETVFRMIDDGLFAEEKGLNGSACFDCRYPSLPETGLSAYQVYDKWLRLAAEVARQKGLRTIVDTKKALFAEGSCTNAVFYCGWYSLANYVDAFTWQKGAVAYHIASGECQSLHGGGRQWCAMLLKDGACATLGPVSEPYVQAFPPPSLFFSLLFNPKLTVAEAYMLSCPYLSWQMVLLADPLYRPGKALLKR